MLHPDFKNGEKLDLQTALSLFVITMGFLFYIDASPGSQAMMSALTMLAGLAWLIGHSVWKHWHPAHHD